MNHIRSNHEINMHNARVLAETLDKQDAPMPPRHALTKGGDPRRLRGIPAIGRNVEGAIPNTRPDRLQ